MVGVFAVLMIFVVASTALYGPMPSCLVELFPLQVRYTSLSLPYNIGTGWIGGFVPAAAYAMVAAGCLDMVIERGLKSWDIDAALPVIAGAGGLVSDWTGEPVGAQGGDVVISGGAACLSQALSLLAGPA